MLSIKQLVLMKKLLFFLSISVFIFSCRPDDTEIPAQVLNPPDWFIGTWNHSDSSTVLKKMTVSSSNLIIENLQNASSIDYIDYFRQNKIEFTEKANHNISYGFEYFEDNEMKLVNFGVIGDGEVHFMTENGPPLETYNKE